MLYEAELTILIWGEKGANEAVNNEENKKHERKTEKKKTGTAGVCSALTLCGGAGDDSGL